MIQTTYYEYVMLLTVSYANKTLGTIVNVYSYYIIILYFIAYVCPCEYDFLCYLTYSMKPKVLTNLHAKILLLFLHPVLFYAFNYEIFNNA